MGYEVRRYPAFLNAWRGDRYSLYNVRMWTDEEGCKIECTGAPGRG